MTRHPDPRPIAPRAAGVLLWGLALAGAALGAACAGGPADGGDAGRPRQAAAAPADPVALSALREEAVELLLTAARDGTPEQRANAIEGLLSAPQRLAGVIDARLADENLGVRAVAAMAVGRAKLAASQDAVRPLLADPSPQVRASAIFALQRLDADVDPSPLAGMLASPVPQVRAHTAFILGELGNRSALAMLREAAADQMPRADQAAVRLMQLQMAEAMVKLGDEAAVQEIRAALYPQRPEDFEATALSAQIIGQVKDRGTLGQLVYLTAYKDREGNRMPAEVRLAAAASLAKLGNPRGSFLADELVRDPAGPVRAQAALVYGETGQTKNLPALEQLLRDPQPLVRVAAAAAILRITGQTAG